MVELRADLHAEIAKLKRANSLLAWALGGGFLLMAGLIVFTRSGSRQAEAESPTTVVARKFVLVDNLGRTRGEIGMDSRGAPLLEFVGQGDAKVELGFSTEDTEFAHLKVVDPHGNNHVLLTSNKEGGDLTLCGPKGSNGVNLSHWSGSSYLSLTVPGHGAFAQLGMRSDGVPELLLTNDDREHLAELPQPKSK